MPQYRKTERDLAWNYEEATLGVRAHDFGELCEAIRTGPVRPGKPEGDLSLASAPDCIEGVPKGSPDGTRILLFRGCVGERFGVTVTDSAGSYRTWITEGFGPDWNPAWKPSPQATVPP